MNMNLTFEKIWINFYPASAKSGAGISMPNRHEGLNGSHSMMSFFYARALWWAVYCYSRVGRFLVSGYANFIQLATLICLASVGGSSHRHEAMP